MRSGSRGSRVLALAGGTLEWFVPTAGLVVTPSPLGGTSLGVRWSVP